MIRSSGAAIALILAAAPALADSNPQTLSSQDRQFLNYAAQDNQAEIALCLLAEKKAQSPALKAFARLMVNDHVEVESRLASVAQTDQASLPEGVGDEGRKTHDKLDPLSGAEFDSAFLKAQIEDHAHDLKRFSDEQKSTQNAALRAYVAQTGPLLDQHLALAQAVQAAMEKK